MMDWLRESVRRLRAVFRRAPLDRELDAELAAHLELAIEENLQRGMPAEEARRRALIRFGDSGLQDERARSEDAARNLLVLATSAIAQRLDHVEGKGGLFHGRPSCSAEDSGL